MKISKNCHDRITGKQPFKPLNPKKDVIQFYIKEQFLGVNKTWPTPLLAYLLAYGWPTFWRRVGLLFGVAMVYLWRSNGLLQINLV